WCNVAWCNVAWCSVAWCSVAWCSVAWRNVARHNVAWYRIAQRRDGGSSRERRATGGRGRRTQACAHLRDALRALGRIDRQRIVEGVEQRCAVVQLRPGSAQALYEVRELFPPRRVRRAEGRGRQLSADPVARDSGQCVEVDRGAERKVGRFDHLLDRR